MQELKQFIPKNNSILSVKLISYKGNIGLPLLFHSIPKSLNIKGIVQCNGDICDFCKLYNKLNSLGIYDTIKSYLKTNNNINLNLKPMSQYLIPCMLYNELNPTDSKYVIMRLWNNSVLNILEFIRENELYHIGDNSCMDMIKIYIDNKGSISSIEFLEGLNIPYISEKLFNFVNMLNEENIYSSVNLIHDSNNISMAYNMTYNIIKVCYNELKSRGYFNG